MRKTLPGTCSNGEREFFHPEKETRASFFL